jgi:valyl-tRNA synthetase
VKSRLQRDADPESRRVAQQTLAYVLEGILKLLHPFMPHITEEIWHTLTQQPADSKQSLSLQGYPASETNLIDPDLEEQFGLLFETIRTIRNLRQEADVKPGVKVTVHLQSESEKERQILTLGQSYIKDLAKVETLTIAGEEMQETPEEAVAGVIGTIQVLLPLAGVVDIKAFSAKLAKRLSKIEAEINSLSIRLSKPNFVEQAPPEVVQGARDALAEAEKQAEILRDRLRRLT